MATSNITIKRRGGATTINRPGGAAMTYPDKLPKFVPPGEVFVHNQIRPVRRVQGQEGSRFWFAKPADHLVACDCGWAPELGTHCRVDR
jgi:hypothetical protein